MYGYFGEYVLINLTTREVMIKSLSEHIFRHYIGGSGLNAKLITDLIDPKCDPLGPENVLTYSVGPFCGSLIPTSGRHQISAKSPLTGTIGESDIGGYWGYAFKTTGFDALAIAGISPDPVYILINDSSISIQSATHLWGLDTFDTTAMLKQKYGKQAQISCIGPSGENCQLIASILHDGREARMAGRGGLGAVMGSKNLKAVVVGTTGNKKTTFFDNEALKKSAIQTSKTLVSDVKALGQYGTVGTIVGAEILGDVPIKNWQAGEWKDGVWELSGMNIVNQGLLKKRFFCKQCPIGCGRVVELSDGEPGGGPEYETSCLFGSNCLIDDNETIFAANELANRAGFDTISAGNVVSMIMEAFEKGIISKRDLNGIEPVWGSGKALIALLQEVVNNSELGALLSQGAARLSKQFGCEGMAMHVKGLELPAHDPRAYSGLGLSYATSNRGACHLQGFTYSFEKGLGFPELGFPGGEITRFNSENKHILTANSQNWMSLCDSLKLCKFSLFGKVTLSLTTEWINLITNWEMDWKSLLKCGERIFTLKRLFNIQAGFSRKDDTLPHRLQYTPKGGGTLDHLPPDHETMLNAYYDYRGWDVNGIPSNKKIKDLNLDAILIES